MPNQDYDKNPKQIKNQKGSNRINLALPHLTDLPRTIVGGNVAPQVNAQPQNTQLSLEDIKRMVKVNYMMRNYIGEIPKYPNNLLAPYYLTEYIKTKNVSVYTKSMLLALGEYVKNSINKQPRRKDIIDFLARTVVSHNNRFPNVPMDQKDVESLIADVEKFFSWTLESRYYDNVARNIYYDDVMDRVVEVAFEPENLELMEKLRKRPILEQEPESIIEVKEGVLNKYRMPEYLPSEDEESLSEEVQEMSGSDVSVASQQDDDESISAISQQISEQSESEIQQQSNIPPAPSAPPSPIMEMPQQVYAQSVPESPQQIDEQPIAEVHQQVDMEQMALQELGQRIHVEGAQQQANGKPVFNTDWVGIYLTYLKKKPKKGSAKYAKSLLNIIIKYLRENVTGMQPTASDVLDYFVLSPKENRGVYIQSILHVCKNFFEWISTNENGNIYYPNIIGKVPIRKILGDIVPELKQIYNPKTDGKHPTAKYFNELKDTIPEKDRDTRIITFGEFIEFLQRKFHIDEHLIKEDDTIIFSDDESQEEAQPVEGQPVFNTNWIGAYLTYLEQDLEKPNDFVKNVKSQLNKLIDYLNANVKGMQPTASDILDRFILKSRKLQPQSVVQHLFTYQRFFRWISTEDTGNDNMYYPDIIGKGLNEQVIRDIIPELRENYNKKRDGKHPTAKYINELKDTLPEKDRDTRIITVGELIEFLQRKFHIDKNSPQDDNQLVAEEDTQSLEESTEQMPLQMLAQAAQQDNAQLVTTDMNQMALQALAQIGQQGSMPPEAENAEQVALQEFAQAAQQNNAQPVTTDMNQMALQALAQIGQQGSMPPEAENAEQVALQEFAQDDQQNDVQPDEERQPTTKSNRRKTSRLTRKSVPTSRSTKVPRQINTTPPVGTPLKRGKRVPVKNIAQQPVEGAQQQIQNGILPLKYCVYYISTHNNLSKQDKDYVNFFVEYINRNCQGRVTRESVVEWMGRNIALKIYYYNQSMDDDKIKDLINCIRDFFSWTAEKNIYNNVADDISIEEIKNKVDELLKNHSFTQKYGIVKPSNRAANTTSQQSTFLRVPPPAVNIPQQIPMQPAPNIQQPIQNGILTSQHFDDYINSKHLSKVDENNTRQFGRYITVRFSGQATKEIIIYWVGLNLARNIYYSNKTISDTKIQEIIDQIKAFFRWAAEKNIYNNVANDISIEEIKNKVAELLKNHSFTKIHVGKPRR